MVPGTLLISTCTVRTYYKIIIDTVCGINVYGIVQLYKYMVQNCAIENAMQPAVRDLKMTPCLCHTVGYQNSKRSEASRVGEECYGT